VFLPDADRVKPPYPGVLIPCGHAKNAKEHREYQTMGALLAINGMVALVFDPIDQGERGQYMGKGGWPDLCCCPGHTMVGMGCILLGQNTARFEIWDGMRAIDYLQSRPEVDPQRIGCTGNSGGGTQTSYLMALDDRIRAAAPSCYITSLPRLLATIGPQDAEQHLFGQMAFGADHADLIMMRAPSPVLICAATTDFFDIGGSWDSLRAAKRLYTRMGFAANVDILENDAGHNYNEIQRAGAARWMSRWLLGKDQVLTEPKIELLSEKECWCTPDGKVMSLPDARSVYDLNEDRENELAKQRTALWTGGDRAAQLEQVRRLAGIRRLSELPKPQVDVVETIARKGCRIEKLLLKPEKDVSLPALLFLPESQKPGRIVLYVHQQGKAADAGPDGPIERLVQAGAAVLAVDLRGIGQTQAPLTQDFYTPEFKDAYIAYILGRSYVGMRAEDVLVCARYAAQRAGGNRERSVELVAVGNVGIPALHAAALEPSLFRNAKLQGMLVSWSNVIHNRLNKGLVTHLVHGALSSYDLPDLAVTLGGNVTIEQPVNAEGDLVTGSH
jgi:dienelactone hydrolase